MLDGHQGLVKWTVNTNHSTGTDITLTRRFMWTYVGTGVFSRLLSKPVYSSSTWHMIYPNTDSRHVNTRFSTSLKLQTTERRIMTWSCTSRDYKNAHLFLKTTKNRDNLDFTCEPRPADTVWWRQLNHAHAFALPDIFIILTLMTLSLTF